MIRYLFLPLTFVLFISGCAPEYMVKNIYIPPIGIKAKECIKDCELARKSCEEECNFKYNNCLNEAYKRAKDIKALEDIEYNKRYNRYKRAFSDYKMRLFTWQNQYDANYRDYDYFLNKCRTNKDAYACNRKRDLKYSINELLRIKPVAPKIPYKKSFEQIYSNEKRVCKSDCGCQKDYDVCFLNCGGTIQMKKICIKNCDK